MTAIARRRISTKERAAIFLREGGVCHLCGVSIGVGELWDISHDIPLELGGEDGGENTRPAHRKCHRAHTAAVDAPAIAKAKRREAAHIGAKRPKGQIHSRGFDRKPRVEKLPMPPRTTVAGHLIGD